MRDLVNVRTMAAFFAAIFFVYTTGAKPQKIKETSLDIVIKAQNLILQKDRPQALRLLSEAIDKELKSKNFPKELAQKVHEVSVQFLSEKSQQLFELALSLKNTDQGLALQKINESLQVEPDNYESLVEKCRMHISMSNCSDCIALAKEGAAKNPYFELILLVGYQAEVCEKKSEFNFKAPPIGSKYEIFWLSAEAEAKFNAGTNIEIIVNKMQSLNSNYPEAHYWRWKMYTAQKRKQEAQMAGMSYINLCRAMSPRRLREFSAEPLLCRRVSDVESNLKKAHNF